MRARSALPLLVAVAVAFGGCGSADDDTGLPTGTSDATSESTTTVPTETTASTAPTTAGPSRPTAFATAARDAGNELKAAWEAGDQARARAIAPGEAVDALFLVDPAGYEVYGCDDGEFEFSSCNWRNRATGGYINLSMQRTEPGWQVASIDIGQD